MSIRTFRKAMGLLLVDIIIIIGIFVLQFRTDSNIIEKIGNLQVTLTKKDKSTEMVDQTVPHNIDDYELMNKFRVAYSGINIYSDEKNPIIAKDSSGNDVILVLENWQKLDDKSCIFDFSNDVTMTFRLDNLEDNSALSVYTSLPQEIREIFIPYSLSSEMQRVKEEKTSIVVNKKKTAWEITAAGFASGLINLNNANSILGYSLYEETKEFTFDSIINLPIADTAVYDANINVFVDNLINAFNSNTNITSITEQVAVSYVAAMAERGKYNVAIESIPASVKKSKDRTYLSAPYFNTLEKMNVLLDNAIATYEQKLTSSANSGSLDIFTVHNIANFMVVHSNPETIKTLLRNATMADAQTLSLAEATGIIQVFVDLYTLQPDYASILYPIVNGCIDRIAHSCSYDNNVLTISENDTFLSVIQAVETGVAVMRYGIVMEDVNLQKAGRVIVNSYLQESSSFDLRTLANLYPLLAWDNPYYPRFMKLATMNGKTIWAWTCANDIRFSRDVNGDLIFDIDFPEGATHYVIIKGVPSFSSIYIYDILFRTDFRFETYNSSGYVYKEPTETLLLKSRHKKETEQIRITY